MQDPILSTVVSFAKFTVTLDLCHGARIPLAFDESNFLFNIFAVPIGHIILFYSIMNSTTFEKGISQFINE